MSTATDIFPPAETDRNADRLPPPSTTLRTARAALLEAIRDGADYLLPLLDEVEAELIERLAARRHHVDERAGRRIR